jgi:hypothetical protein
MSPRRSLSQDLLTAKTTSAKARKIKNLTQNRLFLKKRTRSGRGSNVWAIQRYQKTYLEISWDYPFKGAFLQILYMCEIITLNYSLGLN